MFSEEFSKAVQTGNLNWRTKSELFGHLSREISKFSFKLSATQRDQVARDLVNLFPALKSNIGEGHYGWAQKIYDKMCKEMKRRSGHEPLKKHPRIGGAKSIHYRSLSQSLDWAEDFKIPVDKLAKAIWCKIEKSRLITPTELREVVRVIIAGVLDLNVKPLKRHLTVIARKLINVFPVMKEAVGEKVIGTGYDGLLRKLIARIKTKGKPRRKPPKREFLSTAKWFRRFGRKTN